MKEKITDTNIVINISCAVIIIFALILAFTQCKSTTPQDTVVKETQNFIYVREYKLNPIFNELDSEDVQYHKPVTVEVKLIDNNEKYKSLKFQNIKTKQIISFGNDDELYNTVMKNTNKIYKFKYTFYPKSKEGYTFIE